MPSSLVPTRRPQLRSRVWRWWLLWLSILSILGVTVASGVLLLTKLPPPINCQEISPLSADGDRLYCAQLAAESGKLEQLVAAIALVQHWSNQHPLYPEAQRMMEQWSNQILKLAQQKVNQGDPSGGIAIAKKIPVNSPIYPETQAAIATWRQQWQQTQDILGQFKDALKVQNWSQAAQLTRELPQINQEYWTISRIDTLMQQLASEKQAWQQLQEARDLAKSNQLEQLEEAIALAAQVSPNSYVKAQAVSELSQWSRTLLKIAAIRFENKDFAGVVSVLERIPVNTSLYQEAQDWIRLGRASETAGKDNILALTDALAAVRQIGSKSPVYSKASAQSDLWQSQLQDHIQLQFAKMIANFQQQTGLQMAINQATQVAPGRSQRVLAQTLIAQWRKEIQQIEDQNHLRSAQQLGERGTIAELRSAVEIASKIQLGQPLRLDAQTAIAKWNRQIQTLEDKPVLDLAEAFAQRRDLIAAISTARQIRPERALYSEAQKAIADWVAQVQIAEDHPILEAAIALAAQGRFDAAIATASQIPPERALYQQAQALKSTWEFQQATINAQ